ncbi:relaxase domain-containing protein [Mycobacterium intracellulare]|uniref:relaxase domain-containing protein n=1 Tax=Mycobacterium intracellulare TaxID=1767 RepID=UPI003CC82C93
MDGISCLRHHLLQSVGLEWGPIDPHTGMAEVAGVHRNTITAWSQRATQLREWARAESGRRRRGWRDGGAVGGPAASDTAAQARAPVAGELKQLWANDQRGFVVEDAAQLAARRVRTSTRVRRARLGPRRRHRHRQSCVYARRSGGSDRRPDAAVD